MLWVKFCRVWCTQTANEVTHLSSKEPAVLWIVDGDVKANVKLV